MLLCLMVGKVSFDISFLQHCHGIQRNQARRKSFSPLGKQINPSQFSDKWRSWQQRIAKDVQSDSIQFQSPNKL
jgi:hypothetical protein